MNKQTEKKCFEAHLTLTNGAGSRTRDLEFWFDSDLSQAKSLIWFAGEQLIILEESFLVSLALYVFR